MIRNIVNANNKTIGTIEFSNVITISNNSKPIVIIDNIEDIENIKNKNKNFIIILYDVYTLTIAEIASLYEVKYYQMANIIKTLDVQTNKKSGRRNSSYGLEFSKERLKNMSESQIGNIPKGYIRTQEIKDKISKTLKQGYASGKIKQDPKKQSRAWAEGKYKNVKMGRGIQGYFYSLKTNKDVYFRSLLELKFLILLENNPKVENYRVEPFQIKMPHNMHYTPDVLVNEKILIELKPYAHYSYENMKRFNTELSCLNNYCNKNKLGFVVIYDKDINFEHRNFRRYLKNNIDIIKQYNIRFKKQI